jgi:hypothetical protein
LDRFSVKLTASYLDPKVEQKVLQDFVPDTNPEFLKRTVQLAGELRVAFQDGNLAFTWSTRKLIDFVEFASVMGYKKAIEITLLNWLDKDDLPFVSNLIQKVGLDKTPVSL